jgi:hypothetical protein
MIDVKQAVLLAKQGALQLLNAGQPNLEEIERELYQNRDVWSVTLSVARDVDHLPPLARLGADPLIYRRFLIDAATGELLAMKMREVASR